MSNEVKLFFLDDERNIENTPWVQYPPLDYWWVCRNYHAFIKCVLTEWHPDEEVIFSFDHDLGSCEHTGYDALKWLVGFCQDTGRKIPTCYFHSKNPVGVENMVAYYNNARRVLG